MRIKAAILKHFYLFPAELMNNPKFDNDHRVGYAILAKLPKEDDGSIWITMRFFAGQLGKAYNTAQRVVEDLENAGVIKVIEKRIGGGGGIRISFLNALALAFLLSVATSGTTSHNQNYHDKSAQDSPGTYIM